MEIEEAEERTNLKTKIQEEINIQHTVVDDAYNLCEPGANSQLHRFKATMLKDICTHLEIHLNVRDKKAVLLEKMYSELSSCICR